MPRVRQSLYETRSELALLVCTVLLPVLLTFGFMLLTAGFFLLPPRPPTFLLTGFSLPDADPRSGLANHPVHFAATARNVNKKAGIDYGEIVASVSYEDHLVATGPVMGSFYQPPNSYAPVAGNLTATGPVLTDPVWGRFAGNVSAGNASMWLTLEFKLQFRPKRLWDWDHPVIVECHFSPRWDGTIDFFNTQLIHGGECWVVF